MQLERYNKDLENEITKLRQESISLVNDKYDALEKVNELTDGIDDIRSSMAVTTTELEQAQQLLADQNNLIGNLNEEIGRLTVALHETTVMWSARTEALVTEIGFLNAEINRHIIDGDALQHRLAEITARHLTEHDSKLKPTGL